MHVSRKTVETKSCLIELIKRGWDTSQLAEQTGLEKRNIENQISLNFPAKRARLLVEQVFGFPIFSTTEEFNHRAAMISLFGFDPYLATVSKLLALANERGLYGPTNYRKPRLIESLAAQLSAKPKTKNKSHANKIRKRTR